MFEPFDLSVLLGPEGQVWVSAVSSAGAVHGVPRGGGGVPTLGELEDLTDDFLDAIATARTKPGADLGGALKEILFGEPEILGLYHYTRGVAADQGRQLLVRVLAAPRELTSVPWELTLDPDGGMHQFLTLAPYAHLVRSARSRTYPVRTEPLAPPLNVLVILSSPLVSDEELIFDLFEEKRNLLNELQPLADARLLNIDVEEHPTLENLRRRIGSRRDGYHIVHYLGHALPTGLLLEDRYGRSEQVPPETMNELLRLCPNLRLVLFVGCETARAPDPEAVASGTGAVPDWRVRLSTADRCVRDSCPVVIGMQALLPFRTEWLFTRFFYQALTAGYSVAEATRLARVAIHGDEYVGGERLDWAVPSLIVAGGLPGPIVDTSAPKPPAIARVPREELKLGLVEEDLDFFSRLIQLRLAVDVLTGDSGDRLLVVTGPKGVGKTLLIDRALEDIGERVDFVLYVTGDKLTVGSSNGAVTSLASLVAELLDRRDDKRRQPLEGWSGRDWWYRLAQELAGRRFVIVIDDIDEILGDRDLSEALSSVVKRRSKCRIALVGSEVPSEFLDTDARGKAAYVRLTPFTWDEVWRWIRRNHPVLTRYGKAGLASYYLRLGSHIDRWGQLAEKVAGGPAPTTLDAFVDELDPPRAPAPPLAPTIAEAAAPRGKRPLRIAIAGPFAQPDGEERDYAFEFASALTDWAAEYDVGGRALVPGDDTSSRLAVLLAVESPFQKGTARESDLIAWLTEVMERKPDILVLDYGAPEIGDPHLQVVQRAAATSLVIAAAGNTGGQAMYPARVPEVLAVGALSGTEIAEYSAREARVEKPELFAPETLAGTPLHRWAPPVVEGTAPYGTSYAAYMVAAAAIVVWATNPEREPAWVKDVLLDTARPLPSKYKRYRPRALNVRAALDRARDDLIVDTLDLHGRSSLPELLAGVGLPGSVADAALRRLVAQGRVSMTRAGGTERYEPVA